jgi:Tol biopolymer transport system component
MPANRQTSAPRCLGYASFNSAHPVGIIWKTPERLMANSWLQVIALSIASTLVSGSSGRTDAGHGTLASSDNIAFASHRDGKWQIYAIDPDGLNQRRLTDRPAQDRFPLWSPDRSLIAFGSQVGSTRWDLWVMAADGSKQSLIVSDIVAKGNREWSPDGSRILLSARVNGDLEIVSALADGSTTRLTNSPGDDMDPSWSPDGRSIAFTSRRDGNEEIYVMRCDGTAVQRLTHEPAVDRNPAWSPDGSTIAFVSARNGARDLYLLRPDGTHVERLTTGGQSTNDGVRWSPDGSRIAFQVDRGHNYDIEIVSLADRKRVTFAGSPTFDGHFTWSPDGRQLAFISDRERPNALYVASSDGSGVRSLTKAEALNPAWWR